MAFRVRVTPPLGHGLYPHRRVRVPFLASPSITLPHGRDDLRQQDSTGIWDDGFRHPPRSSSCGITKESTIMFLSSRYPVNEGESVIEISCGPKYIGPRSSPCYYFTDDVASPSRCSSLAGCSAAVFSPRMAMIRAIAVPGVGNKIFINSSSSALRRRA